MRQNVFTVQARNHSIQREYNSNNNEKQYKMNVNSNNWCNGHTCVRYVDEIGNASTTSSTSSSSSLHLTLRVINGHFFRWGRFLCYGVGVDPNLEKQGPTQYQLQLRKSVPLGSLRNMDGVLLPAVCDREAGASVVALAGGDVYVCLCVCV